MFYILGNLIIYVCVCLVIFIFCLLNFYYLFFFMLIYIYFRSRTFIYLEKRKENLFYQCNHQPIFKEICIHKITCCTIFRHNVYSEKNIVIKTVSLKMTDFHLLMQVLKYSYRIRNIDTILGTLFTKLNTKSK